MKKTFIASMLVLAISASLAAQEPGAEECESLLEEIWGLIDEDNSKGALRLIDAALDDLGTPNDLPYVRGGVLYLYYLPIDEIDIYGTMEALRGSEGEERAALLSKAKMEIDPGDAWDEFELVYPLYPTLLFDKAYCLNELEDFDGAIAASDAAIDAWTYFGKAYSEKAYALISLGELAETEEMLLALFAIDLYPEFVTRANHLRSLGYIAIEYGELDEAEDYYRQSLEYEPGNKSAKDQLAYIKKLKAKKK